MTDWEDQPQEPPDERTAAEVAGAQAKLDEFCERLGMLRVRGSWTMPTDSRKSREAIAAMLEAGQAQLRGKDREAEWWRGDRLLRPEDLTATTNGGFDWRLPCGHGLRFRFLDDSLGPVPGLVEEGVVEMSRDDTPSRPSRRHRRLTWDLTGDEIVADGGWYRLSFVPPPADHPLALDDWGPLRGAAEAEVARARARMLAERDKPNVLTGHHRRSYAEVRYKEGRASALAHIRHLEGVWCGKAVDLEYRAAWPGSWAMRDRYYRGLVQLRSWLEDGGDVPHDEYPEFDPARYWRPVFNDVRRREGHEAALNDLRRRLERRRERAGDADIRDDPHYWGMSLLLAEIEGGGVV